MRISSPQLSAEQEPDDFVTVLSRGGLQDLTDMLEVRGARLTTEAAVDVWSGITFGTQVRRHAERYSLPLNPPPQEFVAVAYAHPDVHTANLVGCQLAGSAFSERAVIGVTGHGSGTVHELFSLLASTTYGERRGRVWVFDQRSPYPLYTRNDIAGEDTVCTFEINADDSCWNYESLSTIASRDHLQSERGEPTQLKEDALTANQREKIVTSWASLLSCGSDRDDDARSVVDTDPVIGVTWMTTFSWLGSAC